MPAYNAERTLRKTYDEIPKEFMDNALLIDDSSSDDTLRVAEEIGIKTIVHQKNKGYGANQKTCYTAALKEGADIIVMLHPDYQYNPKLIPAMVTLLAYGPYDVVLASRILGHPRGNMPRYRYIGNRLLTAFENALWRTKLSEFHTGFRGFKRHVLEGVNFLANSDDFVFDNQILADLVAEIFNRRDILSGAIFRTSLIHRFWKESEVRIECHENGCGSGTREERHLDAKVPKGMSRALRHTESRNPRVFCTPMIFLL